MQDRNDPGRDQRIGQTNLTEDIQLRGGEVHMQIDQAGHHGEIGSGDGPGRCERQRQIGDFLDQAAFDCNVARPEKFGLERIEKSASSD